MSIATISDDSNFSNFAGYTRRLMPLAPAGLILVTDGREHAVPQFGTYSFDGESEVSARGVREPGKDLNLMFRRNALHGELVHNAIRDQAVVSAAAEETVVLVMLAGQLVSAGTPLSIHDAVLLDGGQDALLEGNAEIAVARVRMRLRPCNTRSGSSQPV